MKLEQIHSVQNWLPFEKILEKGIVKVKDNSYIKILNISPINYILKSDLEKEAILNSYNNIFKNCNFNMQILVQSKKIDLSNHIKKIKSNSFQQNLKEKYIDYINQYVSTKKSLNKKFYLIIKSSKEEQEESVILQNLQENYIKVRDLFSRCGNLVSEYTEEKQIYEILHSFFYSTKN